jgi:hypothetical protein
MMKDKKAVEDLHRLLDSHVSSVKYDERVLNMLILGKAWTHEEMHWGGPEILEKLKITKLYKLIKE